ncbi:MAG TPA: UPF0182 family protein, partial [Cryptosporangiaceae bacterium]|nr:UPF0182 family protein [Cryptosporangiaceae bacterium]
SFYVFEYPFWRYLLSVGFTALMLSIFAALFVHYLYGNIRLQASPGGRLSAAVIGHLSVLFGLFVALKAVAYYLDRYGLLFGYSDLTKTNGASAADVEFLLPAKNALLYIAVLCALVFFANLGLRKVLPPVLALVLLGISAVVIGGAVPAFAERFQIKPNAINREAEYIKRNITATRAAYGLTGVKRQPYDAKTTASSAELRADKGTIPNVRLLDPSVVSDTFVQLQQGRSFYDFNSQLDIDRYTVDGKTQDYVVGVRELASTQLAGNQTNWLNRHTVFTHGYGFVAAPANRVDESGAPVFVSGFLGDEGRSADADAFEKDVPVDQSRIYYGELIKDYSIVGKPKGGDDQEFDRPAAGDESQQVNTTYAGKGGVAVGSLTRQLLFALHYRETNFVLSDAINDSSKILYVRDPRTRVEKAAPFLTVDGDPYPAAVDGRVVWVVDGYTTSNFFPYAQRETLGEVAADSLTGTGTRAQPKDELNYIRNSVKATVDAYDGTVTLYTFDETDPVLRAWNAAFDGIVKPKSSIPPALAEHFRYPEDLFKTQRTLLSSYHVDNPAEFFNGQDFWKVPDDPTKAGDSPQPPYYLVAQFPGQQAPSFQLTSALTANRRENLAALMSAQYDVNGQPALQVLELPDDSPILGPKQAEQNMRNNADVRSQINIINTGADSAVNYGNLLTLPVGGGLLYVEPIYVRSTGENGYPLLERVLVLFGDKVAYEKTLPEALDKLFGSGSTTPPATTPPATPTPSPSPTATAAPTGDMAAAVAAIKKAIDALRVAQQRGDFAAIGQAQADLDRAIKQFEAAQKKASPSPAPPPG